jgi:hypothetical protein
MGLTDARNPKCADPLFLTGRLIVPAGSTCEPQNIANDIEFRSAGLGRFELSLTAQGIQAGCLKRYRL